VKSTRFSWVNTGNNLESAPSVRQVLEWYCSPGISEPECPLTPFDPNYAELAAEGLAAMRKTPGDFQQFLNAREG